MLSLLLSLACTPMKPPPQAAAAPAPLPVPASVPANLPNAAELEKTWGLHLSPAQSALLATEGFVQLRPPETSIRPDLSWDTDREFIKLYAAVAGSIEG